MARRSDHTREELTAIAVMAGQEIMAEDGFSQFSARKVARHIGYTIGTIYNVFGTHDNFLLNVNAVTLDDMTHHFYKNVSDSASEREHIHQLANAYLTFAQENRNRWSALFEHVMPEDSKIPQWYDEKIKLLFQAVEVPFLSMGLSAEDASKSARTIWAGVHGICSLGLAGKLDIVGVNSIQDLLNHLIDTHLKGLKID